jgi:VWFA-related protein
MTTFLLLLASLLSWTFPDSPPPRKPVFVNASFLGKNRMFVENLTAAEIRVFENGKPRTVEFFAGAEVPGIYGMVFDREILPQPFEDPRRDANTIPSSMAAMNVAFQVIDQALTRQVGWVATYDRDFRIAMDFTQDSGRIKDVIQGLRGERNMEDSSAYGALFNAVKKMGGRNEKRRSIILFLDVLDPVAGDKLKPLKNLLSGSNVELFVASFAGSRSSTGRGLPPLQSEACLRELAGVTAGAAYFSKSDGIEGIGRRMASHIRSLYTIGFESEAGSDQPATLKIECTRTGVKATFHSVTPNL